MHVCVCTKFIVSIKCLCTSRHISNIMAIMWNAFVSFGSLSRPLRNGLRFLRNILYIYSIRFLIESSEAVHCKCVDFQDDKGL